MKNRVMGPSIFSEMSHLASTYGAINLAQGFPNLPIDARLLDSLKNVIDENYHQYAPYQGSPNLREAIVEFVARTQGFNLSVEEILITAGATQALFATIQALVSSGEEAVLLDPCYDCYEYPLFLVGAKPVHLPLNAEFLPDWNLIFDSVTEKTTLIVINSPHNPSGVMWREEDYKQLSILLEKNPQLRVLSDEVYEFLYFDQPHKSLRRWTNVMDRIVVISSFGKSLQATGWKMGYLTAPPALMKAILSVHQYLVFSVNSVMQEGIARFLPTFDPAEVRSLYRHKRNRLNEALQKSKFSILPCEGTYFQALGFSSISDQGDVEFCRWLTMEVGVAAIPFSVFYENKVDNQKIRLCFAKDDQTLRLATEKLCKI
ncbi:MAG: methionine aminotransferase [Flavobacteriales bacterium]